MEYKFEIEANNSNFEKNIIEKSQKTPVVVDFWAEWCSPCLILKPVLEKVAQEYNGKFLLVKINVDENPEIASQFNVMSIPSVKLFKNKEIVDSFTGAIPEHQLKDWLNKNLK